MAEIALTTKRVFDASPEEVFEAWTNPEELAKWHGPEGFTNVIHEHELREGGEYSMTMIAPDGSELPLRGKFIKIEPPTKLTFTWQWIAKDNAEDANEETTVSVELKAIGDKTEMTFTHSGFVNEEGKKSHGEGWEDSFARLEKLLKK